MGNKRERSGSFKAVGIMRDGQLESYAEELERFAFEGAQQGVSRGRRRRRGRGRRRAEVDAQMQHEIQNELAARAEFESSRR